MKMPNFASLYHSGTSYFWRDSQWGRKGPCGPARSTSVRIAARGASYFALPFCQAWSIASGSSETVGAFRKAGTREYLAERKRMKNPIARPAGIRVRIDRVGECERMWSFAFIRG